MTTGKRELPQHPHLEYLRKEAKQRFALLRQRATGSRLADAQHWLAREYGFSSWRALKDEVLRRMGMVRMAPLSRARRFQRPSLTVDENLEADGFFLRGAAVMGIGVIAALVIAAMVMLMLSAGRAFSQPADAAQKRAEQALPRTAIAMDPPLFDKYVGFYQLGPKAVFAVTRDGAHFFVHAGNQAAAEVFPESQTKFFLKIVPAQISFMLDAQGQVTGAVLHQGGRELPLPRIDEAQAAAIAALPKGHPMARTWPVMTDVAPRFLTSSSGGSLDYWPCFSPDGKTVLFSRTTDSGKSWALWRIAASGGAAEAFAKSPLAVSATRAD